MAKIRTLQIYRGTTAQNDAYTGSAGELTMDTTTNELRLHDGTTAGGHIIGSGSGYHPDLFSWQWADHELNDVQWLRADTFSWQSGAVYQAAYQHLVDDIDGKTLQSETIGSTTIQFYLADDGHKICPASEETNVNYIYGTSGVAWYYVIDTVNQRFKLPRTQFGVTGYRGTVGGYIEAGLPNITGGTSYITYISSANTDSGALYFAEDQHNRSAGNSTGPGRHLKFDASLSNSIYGNSTTVQPPATQMYLYFYVGNFTQTALENTAGLNASLFNGKADLNLLNTASNVDFVIERQEPTAANNYTWYRKYRSGRVEQGGCVIGNNTDGAVPVVFPIEMADIYYYRNASLVWTTNGGTATNSGAARSAGAWQNPTTTGIEFQKQGPQSDFYWEVKGKAA